MNGTAVALSVRCRSVSGSTAFTIFAKKYYEGGHLGFSTVDNFIESGIVENFKRFPVNMHACVRIDFLCV